MSNVINSLSPRKNEIDPTKHIAFGIALQNHKTSNAALETSDLVADNKAAFAKLTSAINEAAKSVSGQETNITTSSDVFERTLLEMAGIPNAEATKVHFGISGKVADTMFIDLALPSGEAGDKYAEKLVSYLKSVGIDAKDTGGFDGYNHSIQVKISDVQKIVPQLDKKLDEVGKNNPDLIRFFQQQSNVAQSPTFKGEQASGTVPVTPSADENVRAHLTSGIEKYIKSNPGKLENALRRQAGDLIKEGKVAEAEKLLDLVKNVEQYQISGWNDVSTKNLSTIYLLAK